MQITRQSEYAIRALLELAKLPKGEFIQSRAVSVKQELPETFLSKTVQMLTRTGFVETRRGMQGGIRLAVKPELFTIADVVGAIEGEVAINPCLADNSYCKNRSSCQVHVILQRAQDALLSELDRETFADLVREDNDNIFG